MKKMALVASFVLLGMIPMPQPLSAALTKEMAVQTDFSIFDRLRNLNNQIPLEKNALAQQITLAELKEIHQKLTEDLNERTHYLNDKERKEVINILKEKKKILEKHISGLEATLPTCLQESPENIYQEVITTTGVIIASLAIIGIIYLGSYDKDTGVEWFSWDRLRKNLQK